VPAGPRGPSLVKVRRSASRSSINAADQSTALSAPSLSPRLSQSFVPAPSPSRLDAGPAGTLEQVVAVRQDTPTCGSNCPPPAPPAVIGEDIAQQSSPALPNGKRSFLASVAASGASRLSNLRWGGKASPAKPSSEPKLDSGGDIVIPDPPAALELSTVLAAANGTIEPAGVPHRKTPAARPSPVPVKAVDATHLDVQSKERPAASSAARAAAAEATAMLMKATAAAALESPSNGSTTVTFASFEVRGMLHLS